MSIREKAPKKNDQRIAETRRLLGQCLTKQGADPSLTVGARIEKLREAEAILIESANALLENDNTPENRKDEAIQRVVDLYEARHAADPDAGYDAKVKQWIAQAIEIENEIEKEAREHPPPRAPRWPTE